MALLAPVIIGCFRKLLVPTCSTATAALGGSSWSAGGLGLATARLAASAGTKIFLATAAVAAWGWQRNMVCASSKQVGQILSRV